MGLTTTNLLNLLWKIGVVPIKNAVNGKIDSTRVLTTKEQVEANTNTANIPSAVVVGEIINNLVSDIYVGSDGKLHKVVGGADTVLPFNSKAVLKISSSMNSIAADQAVGRVYGSLIITIQNGQVSTNGNLCLYLQDVAHGKTNSVNIPIKIELTE